MILFSLGTHSQDFSRMAKAADDYAAMTNERIVVQTGYTHYEFTHVKNILILSKGTDATVDGGSQCVGTPRWMGRNL